MFKHVIFWLYHICSGITGGIDTGEVTTPTISVVEESSPIPSSSSAQERWSICDQEQSQESTEEENGILMTPATSAQSENCDKQR